MRLPTMTIITMILLSLVVDFYIWLDIRQGKSRKRWKWSEIYAVSSIALWIFFIVAVCLPHRGAEGGIIHIMWMLTAYASIYISKIVYCIFSLLGRLPGIFRKDRWRWTNTLGTVVAIGGFLYLWYGILVTRHQTQTISVTLESSKLPDKFDGYRIVQISDLHLGTWGNDTGFFTKLVNNVNALNPDLIVFTGDIANQRTDEIVPFVGEMSRMKAKDGVYSILGNHDYGDYVDWPTPEAKKKNLQALKDYQKKAGWQMLNNEHVFLYKGSREKKDSIVLIGVENWGEPPFGQYGDLSAAYPKERTRHLNDKNFKILLTHNPEHWLREVRKISNIDLSLSGHTHALQMSAELFGHRWSPSVWRYTTWGGFYKEDAHGNLEDYGNPSDDVMTRSLDKPSLYVNIGAGEVGMPYRLGNAIPEITIITLKKK